MKPNNRSFFSDWYHRIIRLSLWSFLAVVLISGNSGYSAGLVNVESSAAIPSAAIPSLQNTTLISVADSYVFLPTPTTNYGSLDKVYSGVISSGQVGRALVRFNLPPKLNGATVQSA